MTLTASRFVYKWQRMLAKPLFISRAWKHYLRGIRNVGIIAHIDAGKTTTTERMLYYAGLTKCVGEVHDGDTVTDYMDAERERGITITSAAISFPWKTKDESFLINLIDTPGHVDFTIEVERALRVLDGGIVILDGSAGVQAQTLTVWRQAERNFKIPRIVFINKMDKPASNLESCLHSMRHKLNCRPILTQVPIGRGKDFHGVFDLVANRFLSWKSSESSSGKTFVSTEMMDVKDQKLLDEVHDARRDMVESLCDWDDELTKEIVTNSAYEDYVQIPEFVLRKSIRKIVLAHPGKVAITLVGSSYKNIGVQPLMDAITSYLPHPSDLPQPLSTQSSDFVGMAFKILHPTHSKAHQQKAGAAYTFIRVYSGSLKEGDVVYNHRLGQSEKVSKLFIAFAGDFKPVKCINAGQIGVATGFKCSSTGDVLVLNDSQSAIDETTVPGFVVPDPVLFASVESDSISQQRQLELALENLSREDPSLRVNWGSFKGPQNDGQLVIAGMGELHLEIVIDRIRREYKVDAELGPFMISFRESVTASSTGTFEFERTLFGKHMRVLINLTLSPSSTACKPSLRISLEESTGGSNSTAMTVLRSWQRKALQRGFENAVFNGPLLGYPIADLLCVVHSVEFRGESLSNAADTVIAAAMTDAVRKACGKCSCLLEPIMKLNITSDPDHMPNVIQDLLNRRRGELVENWLQEDCSEVATAIVLAPLSELRGYSTYIRGSTSGRTFFGMEFSHYAKMSAAVQEEAIKDVTGF